MPSPSYWPIVVSAAFPVIAIGAVYKTYPVMIVGAVISLLGIYGWALEPSVADELDYEPPAAGGPTKEIAPLG
jgi:hypothetical protein